MAYQTQFNQSLIFQMHSFVHNSNNEFEPELIKVPDVTYTEFVVLMALDDNKDFTQDQLALLTNFTKSTVSKTIDKLVKKLYLSRENHDFDRRQRHITITKLGKSQLRLGKRAGDKLASKVFASLNQREYNTLVQIITKLNLQFIKD
jgi:DNA-binding MarR family transcriptional regulator